MRLKKIIFGGSEKSSKLLKGNKEAKITDNVEGTKPEKKKKVKGHGRHGVEDFPGAEKHKVHHCDLSIGDACPLCDRGHLFLTTRPGKHVYFTGGSLIRAKVFQTDVLRCSGCQKTFEASLPDNVKDREKYDIQTKTTLAMLKYGAGMPFYRLQNLQRDAGVPLAASTQWDILKKLIEIFLPVYIYLLSLSAQGSVLHMDDTKVRIIELIKQNLEHDPKRKGMHTTGIVSRHDDFDIVLYFSGRNHAGENMIDLLDKRNKGLPPPIQACDALSRNCSEVLSTILSFCLCHGRRKFAELLDIFPEECEHVIKKLKEVYGYDRITKEEKMSPEERLLYHKKYSKPIMNDLKFWFKEKFDQKLVEPNSSLGNAFNYMLKNWNELTLFLRKTKAPLDNNIAERILKSAILNRKNSGFYKTLNGSNVGDIFMSIIQTARLARINVFEYLNCLQENESNVKINPGKWLPWNYKENRPARKTA